MTLQWVYQGYGHWELYPDGHPQAIRHTQAMDGMYPKWRKRREQELKAFLEKRKRLMAERELLDWRMVTIEHAVNLQALLKPDVYQSIIYLNGWEQNIQSQLVPLTQIVPTQEEVNQELVKWYRRAGYLRDEQNQLPYGVRFRGSSTIYLIDGHHRFVAQQGIRIGGQVPSMWIDVNTLPMTFDEACGKVVPDMLLPIPDYVDLGDMNVVYFIGEMDLRYVPTHMLIPTQESYSRKLYADYVACYRDLDDEGDYPQALQFADDDAYYLINGHHRWMASRTLKRSKFPVMVVENDVSFHYAMTGEDAEPFPVDIIELFDVLIDAVA